VLEQTGTMSAPRAWARPRSRSSTSAWSAWWRFSSRALYPAAEKKIHDEFGYSPEVDRLLLHNDAWSRYFLNYDPATALEKLKMPVLALIGAWTCSGAG